MMHLMEAYRQRFGEPPPTWFWSGTDEALAAVLARAIETGEKLTMKSMAEACGIRLPDDPDVVF